MKSAKFRAKVLTASRDDFELLIASVMEGLLPNFARAQRLGERDQLGIDLYQYDDRTGLETIAVQAKTMEREIKRRHIGALTQEIAKYLKLGPSVREYWLVLNKPIVERKDRTTLQTALASLVEGGKAEEALLLDLEGFLKKLEDLARARLSEWAEAARLQLRAEYARRLEVVTYIHDVPYAAREARTGPVAWVVDEARTYLANVHEHEAGTSRTPPRFLLASGFGFGKTTTLHALADRWIESGGKALYVPAAILPQRAFANGAGLVDGLLRMIVPADLGVGAPTWRLVRDTFRRDLARSRDWLLLIDAIDESPYWASQEHLAALWAGLEQVGIPVVVTVREEVYASRRLEFADGPSRRGAPGEFFQVFQLLDWTPELIGQFLDDYAERQTGECPQAYAKFRDAVGRGDYEHLYGDIPRRPLFLGMMAQDAWSGQDPETDLSRLYETYFRNKLLADWAGPGVGAHAVRTGAVTARHGYEETIERMMAAMQRIAASMLFDPEANLPPGTVSGSVFDACVREEVGDFASAEEILLISVLKPAGRHPSTRARLFGFAHQSFYDWFAARELVRRHGAEASRLAPNGAVRTFVRGMSDIA